MEVYLDTGVLGLITHPKGSEKSKACTKWLLDLLKEGVRFCLPEICDYEIRREYMLRKNINALKKLEQLKSTIDFIAIDTSMMIKASELWAEVRLNHRQTADKHALDGDVILVAQTLISSKDNDVQVATTNVGHLSLFLKANTWENINLIN